MLRFRPRPAAAVLAVLGLTAALRAAPPLTTIQDILYKADGTRFNGIAVVQWNGFQASDSSNIATHNVTLRIVDGVLRVRLVPTTTASAGARYVVRYNSDGKVQFTEIWSVPPSATPLRLSDVRVATQPGTVPPEEIEISEVNGLAAELANRPVKGPGFTPSRAAVIGATGQIEAALGDGADCLRADGTVGPCGTGTVFLGGFVDGEEPAGTVDGANATFVLAHTPAPAFSLSLYRNGLYQKQGLDYTLTGSTVVFEPVSIPQPQDILLASYRIAEASAGPISAAQVLCIGNGTATGATVLQTLGQCVIPGGLLKAGDRIDIRFDYAHSGAAAGFTAEVRWGATAMAARSAGAGESLFTGRADASIHGGGAQWTAQSWGATLGLTAGAGDSPEAGLDGVTVGFLGRLDGAAADTLTLRNFAVLRYPAP